MKKIKLALLGLACCLLGNINAQSWNPVGTGLSPEPGCMAVYNGNLYVGGYITNAGGVPVNTIAMWDGTNWSAVGSGITGAVNSSNPEIYAMAVYNGDLYVGGYFTTAGGAPASNIAKWNGTGWSALGSGINGFVHTMSVYNGKLIIGGNFTSANGLPLNNITAWDGTTFSSLGTGIPSGYMNLWGVTNMSTDNSLLYVTGYFDSAGGKLCNSVAQWDGTNWSAFGKGILLTRLWTSLPAWGYTISSYNNELFLGGAFDSIQGATTYAATFWNGTNWNTPFNSASTSLQFNCSMVYNGLLYAGGKFYSGISGSLENGVATWNGSKWDTVGSGLSADSGIYPYSDSGVVAFCAYNGALYATGNFTRSGKTVVNHIAAWGAVTGIAAIKNEQTFSVYPNPSNGIFNFQLADGQQLTADSHLEVYNMLGEEIATQTKSGDAQLSINLSEKPAGIYLYRMLSKTGAVIGSGKLVIEH